MESKIKTTSSRETEFYSKFEVGNETYEVITEDLGLKKAKIVTRIYLKGETLSTTITDHACPAKLIDNSLKLRSIMEKQYESAVETFIKEQSKPSKSKADYAEAIRLDLTYSNNKVALAYAREALMNFPAEPLFLSYVGYLMAIVENKTQEGTIMCEEAIYILRKAKSTDTAFFLPLFYLNLGKTHLKADRKEPAINAFREGLKVDSRNRDLLSEINAIGSRKGPVISFLRRSNPINKYLGKLRHELQNRDVNR